jgi:hypothetical protein
MFSGGWRSLHKMHRLIGRCNMGAEYSPYIIPICTAVVVAGISWLLWLRWRGD